MSDLYIEARLQAIKDIASASCSDIKDADNIASFCDEIYSAIPNLDKIIEELETNQQNALEVEESIKEYNVWNEAIEIVKQGGVSNDVCECRELKDYRSLLKTSCGYVFGMGKEFKYCPYCGKKILAR